MGLDIILNNASSIMTVVSLVTFLGIIAWSYSGKRSAEFSDAENLPFADDDADRLVQVMENRENRHV